MKFSSYITTMALLAGLTTAFFDATSLVHADEKVDYSGPALKWDRHTIDPLFRSEGAAMGDFNKDGQMDVAAGDYWYAAPKWTPTQFRPMLNQQGKPTEAYDGTKGYSNSFANWAYDVNRDGWIDMIVVGFPGDPCYWYENPKNEAGHWKSHVIWHSACNETPLFRDLTGDGIPELIFGSQPERQLGYLSVPPVEKCTEKWKFHPINEADEPGKNGTFKYYHGLGTGDMNKDGRLDVLIPHGWLEQPAASEDQNGLWKYHPMNLSRKEGENPLPASDLHAIDLDVDGDLDVIMCSAHAYGVWWFENQGEGKPFVYHVIDGSFSQTHASQLVDLAGDGTPWLVTGKRYFAHQGKDPGALDDVVMMAFRIVCKKGDAPRFERTEILEGKNTGVGTQFQVGDFNGDKKMDLILSNKKGVHVVLQK